MPSPIRLLMSRKLADAVARMGLGTRCWTAVDHRAEPQDIHRVADQQQRPGEPQSRAPTAQSANVGAAIGQAIAGSFTYQARSVGSEPVREPPPAKNPRSPRSGERRKKLAPGDRPSPKLRSEPTESRTPARSRTRSWMRQRRRASRTRVSARGSRTPGRCGAGIGAGRAPSGVANEIEGGWERAGYRRAHPTNAARQSIAAAI